MQEVLPQLDGQALAPEVLPDHGEDIELMSRVAAGDELAQQSLARRLIGAVRKRARIMIANPIDADDATQIAIVEILKSAGNYRGEGSVEAWSERITARTVLRERRRRARWLRLVDDRVDPDAIPGPASLDGSALPFALGRFFAELSPERREVLALKHRGHTVDEIAAQLQLSPNTVKDRLRMARRELRQRIRQADTLAALRRARS